MMILKIYLVGMLLFVFGFGIYALITEGTSSIGEFIITLLLNVWLFPILFLHRLIKPRLHKLVLKKIQKDFGLTGREYPSIKEINARYNINYARDLPFAGIIKLTRILIHKD